MFHGIVIPTEGSNLLLLDLSFRPKEVFQYVNNAIARETVSNKSAFQLTGLASNANLVQTLTRPCDPRHCSTA